MTEQQLAIMRAGREAQLVALREQHRVDVDAWYEYIANEARLFELRGIAAQELGRDSEQFKALDAEWHAAMRGVKVPSDAAFKAVS